MNNYQRWERKINFKNTKETEQIGFTNQSDDREKDDFREQILDLYFNFDHVEKVEVRRRCQLLSTQNRMFFAHLIGESK